MGLKVQSRELGGMPCTRYIGMTGQGMDLGGIIQCKIQGGEGCWCYKINGLGGMPQDKGLKGPGRWLRGFT